MLLDGVGLLARSPFDDDHSSTLSSSGMDG
jgi:hypothetical protein